MADAVGPSDVGIAGGPSKKVDVLFVIDNTPATLAFGPGLVSAAAFVDALQAGVPSLDLHAGVVTTDLGAGQFTAVPGCLGGGDQGVLQQPAYGNDPSRCDSQLHGMHLEHRDVDDCIMMRTASTSGRRTCGS